MKTPLPATTMTILLTLATAGCGSDDGDSRGAAGSAGSSGTGGTAGTAGAGATAGTAGTAGVAGTAGASGTSGTGGSAGAAGTAGTGAAGSGGASGSSGSGGTAGSAGSAGSGGASGSSGSAGSSGSPSVCATAALCDDFESTNAGGPPDSTSWTIVAPNCSGNGAISIDGVVSHSGTKSLRVDGKGGYCNHVFVQNTAAIAQTGEPVYVRFFVRFSSALGEGHTTFVAMKDEADGGKDLRIGGQSTILMYNRESDDATLPSLSPAGIATSLAPAVDTWICFETKIDSVSPNITTWVDGSGVDGLMVDGVPTADVDQVWISSKPTWAPQLSDIRLGWESYAGQDMTLWIDDVVVSSTPIGCQQ